MGESEFKEIVAALKEEFQGFLTWVIGEIGEGYFLDDPNEVARPWEQEARERISARAGSERVHWWVRDWYAFLDDPQRPSIYKILEVEDLEVFHYLEEVECEHDKVAGMMAGNENAMAEGEKSYEQSFGVLLASQEMGWMYRLDLCEICGLIEVWSMKYSVEELAVYDEISERLSR